MRVLVIEDNEAVAKIVARSLEREGFLVDTAVTASDGSELGRSAEYSLIILDMILPDDHGLSVLKAIRESGSATPILDHSAHEYLSQLQHHYDDLFFECLLLLGRGRTFGLSQYQSPGFGR